MFRLLGVALGPSACDSIVLGLVIEKLLRNGADERVLGIAVGEQRADGEQHLGEAKRERDIFQH